MNRKTSIAGKALWWAYYSATAVAYVLAWPGLALLAIFDGARRREWRERLGFLPRGLPRGALWLHAASVGEVAALAPVLGEIRRRRPHASLVVSTMTEAGRRRAQAAYKLRAVLAPLDAGPCVRRWLKRAAPRALLVMETELWPVWLSVTAKRAPVAWINGRISDRTFPRYMMVRPILRELFSRLRILCVIGERDARRVARLGADAKAIHVLGNVKADLTAGITRTRESCPGFWFVAGSTRTGEDEVVLTAFRRVLKICPRAQLCLAPRHLKRVPSLQDLVKMMGFSCELRSQGGEGKAKVLILDTHGELPSFYGRAKAAFVGGTLTPIGGHNILEPASLGVPVFFGPHTANVRDQAEGLVRRGGGFRVRSASSLAAHWIRCLRSPKAASAAGRRAREFAASQRGAARKLVCLLGKEGLI